MAFKSLFCSIHQLFQQKLEQSKLEEDENSHESLRSRLIKLCPIFTDKAYVPLAGLGGWDDALEDFYMKVEALHVLYYKKYRVKARIAEMKEKYGTLRLDAHAFVDLPFRKKCICKIFDKISCFVFKHVDFKKIHVIDVPTYIEHVEKEILKSDFLKSQRRVSCSNQKFIERDGKYYEVTDYEHYERSHLEPSRFKVLYKLSSWLQSKSHTSAWKVEPTREQNLILHFMNCQLSQFIKEAKDKTWHSCEKCGSYISDEKWNPRCETTGWIRYLCSECAKKSKVEYYKNGNLWLEDKILKTKEQIDQERIEEQNAYAKIKKEKQPEEDALEAEIQKAIEEEKRNDA